MKNTITSIILLLLFSSTVFSDETTWVPIMMGDITFFVPLGTLPTQQPPTSPITDSALQGCINQAMLANNWQTHEQVTELYCVAQGISSISGIDALVNLNKLALGNNFISDISPLYNMQNLSWLHLASYSFTNNIYNSDISGLGSLNLTYLAVPSYSYDQGTELNVSAFPNGFNSLEELVINVQDDYIDCDTLYQLQQRWNFQVSIQFFPTDNSCLNN